MPRQKKEISKGASSMSKEQRFATLKKKMGELEILCDAKVAVFACLDRASGHPVYTYPEDPDECRSAIINTTLNPDLERGQSPRSAQLAPSKRQKVELNSDCNPADDFGSLTYDEITELLSQIERQQVAVDVRKQLLKHQQQVSPSAGQKFLAHVRGEIDDRDARKQLLNQQQVSSSVSQNFLTDIRGEIDDRDAREQVLKQQQASPSASQNFLADVRGEIDDRDAREQVLEQQQASPCSGQNFWTDFQGKTEESINNKDNNANF